MVQPPPDDRAASLLAAAGRLRIDGATAELLGSFERAGVQALLLKGRSIASWLYVDGPPRTYSDCDLLIAPGSLPIAEQVLASLEYERQFDDRKMPSWWREHAGEWFRASDSVTIDLHRTLPGIGVDAETAWRTLSADPDHVLVADQAAETLSLPLRALHVVLHAAQHGEKWSGSMGDLERALSVVDDDVWSDTAELADRLEATEAFAAGLRLVPAGVSLAGRLGIPQVRSVEAQLRSVSPPPVALGFEQLANAEGLAARARILWRKFVPPPDFIRHWDPRAGESRLALARAYLRRPAWIIRQAPRGFSTWYRARRAVRPPRAPRR